MIATQSSFSTFSGRPLNIRLFRLLLASKSMLLYSVSLILLSWVSCLDCKSWTSVSTFCNLPCTDPISLIASNMVTSLLSIDKSLNSDLLMMRYSDLTWSVAPGSGRSPTSWPGPYEPPVERLRRLLRSCTSHVAVSLSLSEPNTLYLLPNLLPNPSSQAFAGISSRTRPRPSESRVCERTTLSWWHSASYKLWLSPSTKLLEQKSLYQLY